MSLSNELARWIIVPLVAFVVTPSCFAGDNGCGPLTIAAPVAQERLPDAFEGDEYNFECVARGASVKMYRWWAEGLPSGMGMMTWPTSPFGEFAFIAGHPAVGSGGRTYNATLFVEDLQHRTTSVEISLFVHEPMRILGPGPFDPIRVGEPLSTRLEVEAGYLAPGSGYTFNAVDGDNNPYMPPGLAIDSLTGEISGTPTETGMFSFVVYVTDDWPNADYGTAIRVYTLEVVDWLEVLTPSALPIGREGDAYMLGLHARGGIEPYTWSFSNLPSGLSWTQNGRISGILDEDHVGAHSFTAVVHDAFFPERVQASFSLSVIYAEEEALAIKTTVIPFAQTGEPYRQTFTAIGGEAGYTWQVFRLPVGLTLEGDTITGTVPHFANGQYFLQVLVTDASGLKTSEIVPLEVRLAQDASVSNSNDTEVNSTIPPLGILKSGGTTGCSLGRHNALSAFTWILMLMVMLPGMWLGASVLRVDGAVKQLMPKVRLILAARIDSGKASIFH